MPAVYAQFFAFPLDVPAREALERFLGEVRGVGGIALVTLEPWDGLSAITAADCVALSELCAEYERTGLGGVLVRFAHEMNGNWYPWCQQPARYQEKFRLLAEHLHGRTRRGAMLWAPNHGEGYPFAANATYRAEPGTEDFRALDTNGDGILSESDDMYEPFYPFRSGLRLRRRSIVYK